MVVKTAADVANEKMEQIRKDKASKSEEAALAEAERIKRGKQGAPPEATPPEKEKTEDELKAEAQKNKEAIRQKAEAEAKENAKLLNTPDDKLDEEQKKKKAILKDQSKQEKIDGRIGELHSEIQKLKGSKEVDGKKIAELTQEIERIKDEKNPDKEAKAKADLEKAQQDRINKVIEEDKDKPPEERREMLDEALNDWLMEDYAKASAWITRREIRRDREAEADTKKLNISKSQKESYKKMLSKNPKMDVMRMGKRAKGLKEEGKSNEEIGKILAEEMPEAVLATMIVKEHPEWESESNAPELVAEEVIKRMKAKPDSEDSKKIAKLEKELEEIKAANAEAERQKAIDADISSSRKGKPMHSIEKMTELQEKGEAIRVKAGISKEKLAKTIERRKKIPGANTMTKQHYEKE